MSWLKSIFGGKSSSDASGGAEASKEHKGFKIMPTPMKEGAQFRLAGVISKDIDGMTKQHKFIRADLFSSKDEAVEFAFRKAELIIDQSGEGIFS